MDYFNAKMNGIHFDTGILKIENHGSNRDWLDRRIGEFYIFTGLWRANIQHDNLREKMDVRCTMTSNDGLKSEFTISETDDFFIVRGISQ